MAKPPLSSDRVEQILMDPHPRFFSLSVTVLLSPYMSVRNLRGLVPLPRRQSDLACSLLPSMPAVGQPMSYQRLLGR